MSEWANEWWAIERIPSPASKKTERAIHSLCVYGLVCMQTVKMCHVKKCKCTVKIDEYKYYVKQKKTVQWCTYCDVALPGYRVQNLTVTMHCCQVAARLFRKFLLTNLGVENKVDTCYWKQMGQLLLIKLSCEISAAWQQWISMIL